MKYVASKNQRAFMADLKPVYTAADLLYDRVCPSMRP
jgi:hypothetical protein